MRLVLEDPVPYDESSLWRIHDAYYAARAAAAWTAGEIPSGATSNFPRARQHARLLLALVRELEATGALRPGEEVRVLEIGAGSGAFATAFLRALERGCGRGGRSLLARLRYFLTDASEATVREAAAGPELARWIAAGTLVARPFDLAHPLATPGPRFHAAFASYVCCVARTKLLRKTVAGPERLRVSIAVDRASPPRSIEALAAEAARPDLLSELELSWDWERVALEEALPDARDRAVFTATLDGLPEATLAYPSAFVAFVRALPDVLVPGGLLLVTDFGRVGRRELRGSREPLPTFYGNSLNHGVAFALFVALARLESLALERTRDPLASVHTLALRTMPERTAPFRRAFRRIFVRSDEGQTLLVLKEAARAVAHEGAWLRAARLFRDAVRLDPWSAELRHGLAEACLEAKRPGLALVHARAGRELAAAGALDFDFLLGRIHAALGRCARAARAFRRSLAAEESAVTRANLGYVLEALGDRTAAVAELRRSLELDPGSAVAADVRARLGPDEPLAP